MRTLMTLAVGAVLGAVIAVLVLMALDDETVADTTPVANDEVTTSDCLELISDDVVATLGWSLGEAGEHVGRCERTGDDGSITVGDLAIVATSAERAEAAEQEFDTRCLELLDGDPSVDLEVDWLPEGTKACVRPLPPDAQGGVAELFLLTDGDEVVQIRLVALTPTAEDAVQDAFGQLVEAADDRW